MKKYNHEEYVAFESFVIVTAVTPGSPADKAGVREGDIIASVDGRRIQFGMTLDQIAQGMQKKGGAAVLTLKRGARSRYGGESDLKARAAFAVDDTFLYFAAEVTDDMHVQAQPGFELWRHDSIQIGLDPVLDRNKISYGENNHEIGFALKDGRPVAWRWNGRRGQPLGVMKDARVAIRRDAGQTIYEAAVPLTQLAPLSPDMWPRVGLDVVVNDSDGEDVRKGRLELVPGAMTRGKYPEQFAVFEIQPSGNPRKVSAALFWETRAMPEGGAVELLLGIRSPESREAIVRAELSSLDSPDAPTAVREIRVPVCAETAMYRLLAGSGSPAGRYRLKVGVTSASGQIAASDELPVFIYPLGGR